MILVLRSCNNYEVRVTDGQGEFNHCDTTIISSEERQKTGSGGSLCLFAMQRFIPMTSHNLNSTHDHDVRAYDLASMDNTLLCDRILY